jgi:hypothetical protein
MMPASLAPSQLTGQITLINIVKPRNHREKRCQVSRGINMLSGNKENRSQGIFSFCQQQAQYPGFQIECIRRMFEARALRV